MKDAVRHRSGREYKKAPWLPLNELHPTIPHDIEAVLDFHQALRALKDPQEKEVILRKVLLGESGKSIAQDWGVHETRVSQIYTVARNHLMILLSTR
jgi:DNA-directed RNA polymerase specialized sigma24 family protein